MRSTRFNQANKINIPMFHKTLNHNQFLYNAIKLWNDIPPHLKLEKSPKKQAQIEGGLFIVCILFYSSLSPSLSSFFLCLYFFHCSALSIRDYLCMNFNLTRVVSRVTA